MEFTSSWGVESVWGNYSYYNTGEPAADKYAFVIDSGISLDTNDLNVNTEWAKSFVPNSSPFDDVMGHGTAVASVIGAKADEYGLTGVAPGAQVVPLKVFGNGGFTTNRRVQDACAYAMEIILANDLVDKAVVNLSLGVNSADSHDIIQELNAAGIQVVVAAGNSARDVDGVSPASYGHLENVYTVSATTEDNRYSNFTNFDGGGDEDDVDYAAPGSGITVYSPSGGLRTVNGTSFSAPHVAGLLLMGDVQAGPTFQLSTAQVRAGMEADPLALLAPEPIIEYVEVPVIEYVEVPVIEYVEVPVTVIEYIELQPPETTFVGELDTSNRIKGSQLDDVIIGGYRNDVLKGGKGDDYIVSFGDKDKVRGGNGEDTFVLSVGDGFTVIRDYDPLEDTIVLPSDDYTLVEGLNKTKLYIGDDFVARINGHHTTIV